MVSGIINMEVLSNSLFLPFPHLFLDEYHDNLTLVIKEEFALPLFACEKRETVILDASIEAIK